METVDGADVGEDSLNHITGEGGARPSLLQESGTENLQEEKQTVHSSVLQEVRHCELSFCERLQLQVDRSHQLSHLVQEVELRDVGGLCVQQLVGDVVDPLLDRQLDRQKAISHTSKRSLASNQK